MKQAKERIIFNNYDLWQDFDYVKENPDEFFDNDLLNEGDFPSDDEIWDFVYDNSNDLWNIEEEKLDEFFDNESGYVIFGSVGLWDGRYEGGEFFSDWYELQHGVNPFEDCDYAKLYDVNGHFYIECSHHDGTDFYEIRELTKRGKEYYETWEYSWDDRSRKDVITKLVNDSHYSRLPRYMEKVYGCPAREYA